MSSNFFLKSAGRNRFLHRSLALLLALILLLALLPRMETKAEAAYYDDAIQKLIGWNVMQGYPDGSLHADSNITRAEFVALVNRAYGYDETTVTPFTDVPESAWYRNDISSAYAAGYFSGTSPTTAGPSEELTREQAMVMLARNMRLEESAGEVTNFSDGRTFQSYSAGYANTAVAKGLISGYTDGSFRPKNNITRGDMAVMLSRALGNLVNSQGTYALGDVFGNVTINSTNVTLRDTTIAGDLYLTGGLGLGGVTLENVRVLGDIIVAGGGESDEGESIILRNVTADNVIVNTLLGEYVSLRAEGDTNISKARLISDAYLQDRTASGLGFKTVQMERRGGVYSLSGNLENVVNAAPDSMLRVSQGIVKNLTMDEAAVGASLWLDSNATVLNLSLDTAASVTGWGDIRKLNVNVAGSTVERLPDEIEIRPGLTGTIAGETMDSTAAAEASSEPHIQAGYPNMINVAATTATATFSTNKSGTIYWAVTAIADGSVNEEALLTPGARSAIVKSGNLRADRSNTVYSVNITGLTTGGNYYLTAMLVDARGDYSPIKVASFTMTDNTTPAFGSGYPYMSRIEDTYALATVMATKNCQLYWVVFDKGSTAPTASSFRSGAFTGAYGFGVMDMERNISETIAPKVNNLIDLEELKSYDIYFWLNDPDSAKSSAVKKLTFTTVDRTPPNFNPEPTVTTIAATSLKLTTGLDEPGTIYWVIVEDGEEYPKLPTEAFLERYDDRQQGYEEFYKLQIANGMNGLKAGSVKVRANTSATINITGLQAETAYKIFYLAMDNAGNYSSIKTKPSVYDPSIFELDSNWLLQSTLDERAPTVTQEFTRYRGNNTTQPYADTSIRIVFNERVQYYDQSHTPPEAVPLLEAYVEGVLRAEDEAAAKEGRENLAKLLRNSIKLYSVGASLDPVKERDWDPTDDPEDPNYNNDDWVIDYRYAEVMTRGKEMIVLFPTDSEDPDKSALNLNSDATYYFTVENIADTSDQANPMGLTKLENFTTIPAQVNLAGVNLLEPEIKNAKLSDGTTDNVRIHTAFSMTPVSVSRADPSKSWDMLVWADKNVTFQLYRLERDAGEPFTVEGDWEQVGGDMVISVPGDDQYHGLSYWRSFKKELVNPSVRDEDKGLSDAKVYYYAIRVLTVEGVDAAIWSGSVNFWITVDTGDNDAFDVRVPEGMSVESTYNEAVDPKTTRYRLVEISVSTDGSEQFLRTVTFADTEAPGFKNGHPGLTVTDTSLDLSVLLERAGTVYYVIAPANGKITTNRLNSATAYTTEELVVKELDSYKADDTVNYGDFDVPTSGNAYYDPANMVRFYNGSGDVNENEGTAEAPSWKWYPCYLSSPTNQNVFNARYTYADPEIKYGSIEADGSSQRKVQITGLNVDTPYFLYVVTKSASEVYAPYAQVYQFHTAEAYRPKIEILQAGDTAVNVRSIDMDAAVEYALFQLDLMYTSDKMNRDFVSVDVMGQENYDQYKKDFNLKDATDDPAGGGNMASGPLAGKKVYEAMLSGPNDGSYDSYFDRYASAAVKMDMYFTVTSSTDSGGGGLFFQPGTGGTPENLAKYEAANPNMLPIDCDKKFTLKEGTAYYLLTVSRYQHATDELTGNSYAFHAYSPISKINSDMPKLVSIAGNVEVDYTKTPTEYNGFIYVTFDKEIYYKEEQSENRQPVHLYKKEGQDGSTTYRPISDLVVSSSGMQAKAYVDATDVETGETPDTNAASYKNKSTRVIELEMTGASGYIIFKDKTIASAYSQAIDDQIRLDVSLGTSDNGNILDPQPVASSKYQGPDIWQGGQENVNITVTVKSNAPTPQNISISTGSPVLNIDDRKAMVATVTFDKTSTGHTVEWKTSDPGIVQISPNSTTYPSTSAPTATGLVYTHTIAIIGVSQGSATITATCGGKSSEYLITVRDNSNQTQGGAPGQTQPSAPNRAPAQQPTSPTFMDSPYTIGVGQELDMNEKLNLGTMEVDSILWNSSDPPVVQVYGSLSDRPGVVKGWREGSATITAVITSVTGSTTTLTAVVNVKNS